MRYLIKYQLEEQEPETTVVSARTGYAITKLKEMIVQEQIEMGLEQEEAEQLANTVIILEQTEVE